MQRGTLSLPSFSKKCNKVALQPSEFAKTTHVQQLQTCVYLHEELLAMTALNRELYTACRAVFRSRLLGNISDDLAAINDCDLCTALSLSNQDIVCSHGFLHQVQLSPTHICIVQVTCLKAFALEISSTAYSVCLP